jgi:hypothetical protein
MPRLERGAQREVAAKARRLEDRAARGRKRIDIATEALEFLPEASRLPRASSVTSTGAPVAASIPLSLLEAMRKKPSIRPLGVVGNSSAGRNSETSESKAR